MAQTSSGPTPDFVPPASMEEAKARLDDIKLRKKELTLEKKQVAEEMRGLRAEYSNQTGKRATRGKGVGAVISKDLGRTVRKVASFRNSHDRKSLAVALEPLEERRAAIQAEIIELDRQKLEMDAWIGAQKAETAKPKTASKAPAAGDTDARIAQLEQLAGLKERGILTEAEFQAEKARILAGG